MLLRLFGTILSLVLLGSLFGCGEAPITPDDHRNLDLAVKSYDSGDDARTIQNANAVLMQHTSGDMAMKAYYLRGMANFRSGNNARAVNDLKIVVRNAPSDQLVLRAKDALGELAFRAGDLKAAKAYFEDVIKGIPQNQRPSDHARFRLGCILQRQGNWAQANMYFQRVIYLFPKGKLADEAKKRVNSRKWTIQAGYYRKSENAGELASKLRKAGFDATTKPESRNEKLVFMVLVGRWDNYDSAARRLPAVKKVKTDAFLRVTR
ncbi:MAG: tetratricopeptide repeat protein [Phycisphaerae bacterium]|nr:tetratricopeptide repeat protein [Phycisphaerae bacterium]